MNPEDIKEKEEEMEVPQPEKEESGEQQASPEGSLGEEKNEVAEEQPENDAAAQLAAVSEVRVQGEAGAARMMV